MRQHAIAGAEIVDGDLEAGRFEPGERDPGRLDVLNHNAFGDLQAYRPAVETEFGGDAGARLDETGGDQPTRRYVDAHPCVLAPPAGAPPRELRKSRPHDPAAQFP